MIKVLSKQENSRIQWVCRLGLNLLGQLVPGNEQICVLLNNSKTLTSSIDLYKLLLAEEYLAQDLKQQISELLKGLKEPDNLPTLPDLVTLPIVRVNHKNIDL